MWEHKQCFRMWGYYERDSRIFWLILCNQCILEYIRPNLHLKHLSFVHICSAKFFFNYAVTQLNKAISGACSLVVSQRCYVPVLLWKLGMETLTDKLVKGAYVEPQLRAERSWESVWRSCYIMHGAGEMMYASLRSLKTLWRSSNYRVWLLVAPAVMSLSFSAGCELL